MRVRFECEKCGHEFGAHIDGIAHEHDCPKYHTETRSATTTGDCKATTSVATMWQCNECSSLNETHSNKCSMCGRARLEDRVPDSDEPSYGPITRKDLVAGIRVAACYYSSEKNEDAIADYFIRLLKHMDNVQYPCFERDSDYDWRSALLRLAQDE